MRLNVSLSSRDILEKKFNVDAKGYRPQEVDEYLDMVIQDYNSYNRFVNNAARENQNLIEENNLLKNEIRRLKIELNTLLEEKSNPKYNSSNIDILKRLSNLEKAVYGNNKKEEEE